MSLIDQGFLYFAPSFEQYLQTMVNLKQYRINSSIFNEDESNDAFP